MISGAPFGRPGVGRSTAGCPLAGARSARVRSRKKACTKLVLPLPLGPMRRLKGSIRRLVARSALKCLNWTEAITSGG